MENLEQPQPAQPDMPVQAKSVLSAVIITAVITAVIVGSGTYFLMRDIDGDDTTPTETPTATPTATEEATATPSPNALNGIRVITSWQERGATSEDVPFGGAGLCEAARRNSATTGTQFYLNMEPLHGSAECSEEASRVLGRIELFLGEDGWDQISCDYQAPPSVTAYRKGNRIATVNSGRGCAGGVIGNADITLFIQD